MTRKWVYLEFPCPKRFWGIVDQAPCKVTCSKTNAECMKQLIERGLDTLNTSNHVMTICLRSFTDDAKEVVLPYG